MHSFVQHYSIKIAKTVIVVSILFFQQTYSIQVKLFGLSGEFVNVVTVDTTKPNTLYVGSLSNFSSGQPGNLFKTTDGGYTWDTLLKVVTVTDIDIHPFNSDIIYVTIGVSAFSPRAVLKSTDGGGHWNKTDLGIFMYSESGPGVLTIDPKNPEYIYVGTSGIMGGRFYKSTDGGNSWSTRGDTTTNFRFGVTAIAINPDSSNIIYAGTNQSGDIYKSIDFGDTWKHLELSGGYVMTIVFGKPTSTVYVGTSNGFYYKLGIFQSTDAGNSWQNMKTGIIDSIFDGRSIKLDEVNGKQRIYLAGNMHEGLPRIYYKYVDESNWTLMQLNDTISNIRGIEKFKNNLLIYSHKGIVEIDKPTNVVNNSEHILPESFYLNQNYPNPFNPSTSIRFGIPEKAEIDLSVYNLLGQKIVMLKNGFVAPGEYLIKFNGSGFPSGIYFLRLNSNNNYQITRKMLLIK